jgi:hypothetical protein
MNVNQIKIFEILHDSLDEAIDTRDVKNTDSDYFTMFFRSILNKNLEVIENKEDIKRLNEILFCETLNGRFFKELQNNIFDIQYILKFATNDFK